MPDSHNAGDFGQFLLGAPICMASRKTNWRTAQTVTWTSIRCGPGHPHLPGEGAGGGVYVGDAHAMQGDGEIAGHTTDVSAEVTLQVNVLKGLKIGGPILLPPVKDLPHLAVLSLQPRKRQQRIWGRSSVRPK